MKKLILCALLLVFPIQTVFSTEISKADIKKEKVMHQRIAKSIKELRETISCLQKAPHDFGGHRAEAVAACEQAIKQLQLALEYRAEKDYK